MNVTIIGTLKIRNKFVDIRKYADKKPYYIVRECCYVGVNIKLIRATYEIFEENIALDTFKEFCFRMLMDI